MGQAYYNREEENKKKGFIISTMFHVLLLLLMLSPFFSFTNEKKEPLSGIIVALGSPDAAIKEYSPSAKSEAARTAEPQKQKAKVSPPKTVSKPKNNKSVSPPNKQKVVSQTTTEEAPVVATKKVAKTKTKSKAPSKTAKQLKAEIDAKLAEQKAKEAAEKAREEAAKAAEAKRQTEAAAKAKADAKSKFSNLLNNGDQTNAGSKGDPRGKPNAKALEGLSTGSGRTGSGFGDRNMIYQPTITDNTQKTGKVNINICVDASGKVIKAKYTQKGSTTTDAYLIKLAEKNALKYKFDKSSAEQQCGTVIIDFRLK